MTEPARSAPPDDFDAGLAGDLSSATDEQWLAGHSMLIATGDLPVTETAFLYDPGRDPAEVTREQLTLDGRPDDAA